MFQDGNFSVKIVIVENRSEDGLWRIIKTFRSKWTSIVKTHRASAPNANIARNKAFELCTGDYIQWLDADDELIKKSSSTHPIERH